MHVVLRSSSPHTRSRGSILVNTAIALSLIVITLIGTEIGFMYFMKREFQKTADLAALAGAQQIRGGCVAAVAAAQLNANGSAGGAPANMPVGLTLAAGEVQCGYWDKDTSFQTPAVTGAANAVRVSFQKASPTLLSFFTGNRLINVTAVAALSAPLAEFSVGSKLITVSGDSTLGRLLKGIGLDLSGTSLVAYDGLAQVKITPSGLLAALRIPVAADIGVGELNTLLAGRSVMLGDLLNAIVTVAGQDSLLSSNIALLQAIQAKLGLTNLPVQLGSLADGPRGLFAQIVSPGGSGSSALNVGVSALDLLYTSIGVATSQHAVDTGLNINLLGLAKVTTQVTVIEPPSVAIGGIGAKAYNAQVRSFIHVTDAGLLGSLVKLDLPIVLDAVTGTGTIVDMCTPALQDPVSGKDRVKFNVSSKIANVCVGQVALTDLFSKSTVCSYPATLKDMELINVLGLLKVNNHLDLGVLKAPDAQLTLAEGETGTTSSNNLQLGTLVSDLLGQLSNLLFGGLAPTGTPSSGDLDNLTNQIWDQTATVCSADTSSCRALRLDQARTVIAQNSQNSGLLTGLLNGLTGLLTSVTNPCSGVILLGGGDVNGCKSMIKDTLSKTTDATTGGKVSNALAVLAGLLKPLLDAIGSSVLTPLLTNVLGINLGQIDVNLKSLDCKGLPMLVY
ncbi:putative membrane protein [Variovorax sp. CF313]|uniref:TadG family pilus assembly protein n=1 Tax=Variovorax sp. CF313 TaxID=1144315 RepID=UPI0002711961|nr:TadG family pilus assembly protein [Variovorax sp. CF313]EJL71688.1 putative membrane protein [Variovorax sp. CF313]